ncbi:MAG TPA: ECF transporter S component [Bacteroidales bacterium]|nr:ECF transporter S component [Bacteroidales bacterium]
MAHLSESGISIEKPTLAWSGVRAFLFQGLLIILAVALPALAHLSGAPVRVLVPMHWVVILAALVYGWRGGLLTAVSSPVISFLLTGFPFSAMLPVMILELAAYGFLAGFLRERFRLNPFLSVFLALLGGKAVYAVAGLILYGALFSRPGYIISALAPGVVASLLMIAVLPLIAGWWIRQERK